MDWSDPDSLRIIEQKIDSPGAGRTRAITNYVILHSLATENATFGLISTATVIGCLDHRAADDSVYGLHPHYYPRNLGRGPHQSRTVLVVSLSIAYVPGLTPDFGAQDPVEAAPGLPAVPGG